MGELTPTSAARHTRVAIVGSGFGGLGTAIRLTQEGERDFLVFERAEQLGGVWRDNSYPGCACDVESHLYSFSFARNPSWSRAYSPQAEILQYLRDCAARFGLAPHLRLGHAITEVAWDADVQRWRLGTSRGEFTADVLVAAVGALSEPKLPALPGLATFAGKTFHSARWNHDVELAGKAVAVVGTGASAIQFVPAIQPTVGSLALFQRTPPWVLPRNDRALSERRKELLRASPLAQRAVRAGIFAYREASALAFLDKRVGKLAQRYAMRYLEDTVEDPVLRAKLTPSYALGCKRVLISDNYLPALAKPNVDVITDSIREVVPTGIVTEDGRTHAVDTIIFGTGFHVQDYPFARAIRGREGKTLDAVWNGKMVAHLGTTISGFPNLFILQGPNTGLGHSSVILMIESQIEHLLGALRHMKTHAIGAVEPTPAAQAAFVADVEKRTEGTVWTSGGCDSWYLDQSGRNSTLWPGFTFTFKRKVEKFRPAEYAMTAAARQPIVLTRGERVKGSLARAIAKLPDRVQRALLRKPPVVVDGQTLATEMQLVIAAMTKDDEIIGAEPGALRIRQRRVAKMINGTPVEVGAVADLTIPAGAKSPALRARHYAPPTSQRAPLVVFFHGGGFVFGDVETHDQLCRMLCRHAGVHVLAIEYRLAPEHPFPAAVDDTLHAYRWARVHASALGADATRIAVCGDSAGGNLATVVAQTTARTPEAPTCQVLIYPTVDRAGDYPSKHLFGDGFVLTREATTWFHEQYIETSGESPDDPRVRAINGKNLAGQAPALVVTAGFDPLRDEGEAYAAQLRANGSPAIVRRFETLIHGFANMTSISRTSHDAIVEIAGSLRAMLGLPALATDQARTKSRSTPRLVQ